VNHASGFQRGPLPCAQTPAVIGLDTHTRRRAITPGHSEVDYPFADCPCLLAKGLVIPAEPRSGCFDVAAPRTDGPVRAARDDHDAQTQSDPNARFVLISPLPLNWPLLDGYRDSGIAAGFPAHDRLSVRSA
jgi:hypothetical protein